MMKMMKANNESDNVEHRWRCQAPLPSRGSMENTTQSAELAHVSEVQLRNGSSSRAIYENIRRISFAIAQASFILSRTRRSHYAQLIHANQHYTTFTPKHM